MPFDSGVGAGRTLLSEHVRTEFVLMGDDDFIFLPDFDIARGADFLRRNPEVDIYGGRVLNLPHLMPTNYHQQALFEKTGPRACARGP